jgi:hypothetical protein
VGKGLDKKAEKRQKSAGGLAGVKDGANLFYVSKTFSE